MVLKTMINNLAADHTAYMKNAAGKCQQILDQARKEGVPNEQLRKLIEEAFKRAGLSDRTIRKALPPELKNQNMIRKQPKKDPLVKQWEIEFNVNEMHKHIKLLLMQQIEKGYLTHDNRKVLMVYGK